MTELRALHSEHSVTSLQRFKSGDTLFKYMPVDLSHDGEIVERYRLTDNLYLSHKRF